jgi:serine phosphatase RsbU (regulator of sigma subunit)
LQVAEATQSVNNLNELLNTVIRITPMLAGVKACLLYILDEDGDFVPAAASELSADQQAEFERWRFAPGDVPALDHLAAEHHPIILRGTEDDRSLVRLLYPDGEGRPAHDLGLSVLIPLLARNEVLGALVVDYSASAAGLNGKSLEAFFDERLAILQGIAHQTAVAVDNMRLLKMQKEDAYVSVALLQVAQAVVSSNDLDEALGSIVRITPILVGVKRALVYLWDETHHRFHLAQSYGAPRAAEAPVFAEGEFPLLDAVVQDDTVLAFPLWDELSGSESIPHAWTVLQPPDLDTVDEYLENAPCLLLAFPLTVKNDVLGVLVVEEPEPGLGESGGLGGTGNRRLRAKRMEIITGISHQAALAVQNDLLQRETVERERMAREMQLAREIQTAFLPQVMPDLPGWDMQVLWRTAREVGGDFYDFFPLPGNRLGLVMADVADKGMPAALFMTLVRTLVRATVPEVDSPAGVLMRVNEIIAPEAYKGMFVTLFYGVLDLDTGTLEFANAGHNPPLLLRPSSCAVERLERTGMALGVEDHTRLQDGKCQLASGEALVLYTDGVTEAFDPAGDIFTEVRLIETAQGAMCEGGLPDAKVLLSRIDEAVTSFTEGADPSDDLTLMVLKYL